MFWHKFKMNVMMFLSLIFLGIREIMLYVGFALVAIAGILFIDATFLGNIITPMVVDAIKAVL